MEAKGNDFEINETAGQYQTTLYMYVLNEIVFSRLELTCGRNTHIEAFCLLHYHDTHSQSVHSQKIITKSLPHSKLKICSF